MGKGPNQKRKAKYYQQGGAKKARYNKLDAGMRGFLITCNNREREAVKEAYNLLDEYAEILYGPEKKAEEGGSGESHSEGEEEDIAAALKKEIDSMKETKPSQRRFQQVDTGTRNVVFIRTTLDDPSELVDRIFSECYESKEKKSRYIIRMLPVVATCNANDDQITKTLNDLLERYIGHGKPTSYCFQIKVRNNNGVSRTHLIPVLGRVVEEVNPVARVDLNNPDHHITVDVLKTVACLGCVQAFNKYKKYNLQEVANVEKTTERKNKEGNERVEEIKKESANKDTNTKEENESVEETEKESDTKIEENESVEETGKESASKDSVAVGDIGKNSDVRNCDDVTEGISEEVKVEKEENVGEVSEEGDKGKSGIVGGKELSDGENEKVEKIDPETVKSDT